MEEAEACIKSGLGSFAYVFHDKITTQGVVEPGESKGKRLKL